MKGIVLKVRSPKSFYSRRKDISYFLKRYGLFTMFLLSILIGFAVGIYAGTHNGESFRQSFDFLFPTDFDTRKALDFIGLFSSNFAPMFLFFITVFFLAFCPWGNAVTPLITGFRGFGAGLTLTQLCFQYGGRGFAFFMLAVVPGFFILSASIAFQGEQSFLFSSQVFKVIIKRQNNALNIREFVMRSGTYLFMAMLSAVVDTVLFLALYPGFNI